MVAAEDRELGRPVALKLLTKAFHQGGGLARFLQEARIAAGLRHPHIVEVMDAGNLEAGGAYIVYQMILGRDLQTILKQEGPRPPLAVARWGVRIAQALASAHAAGVIHRDLKPANILVRAEDGCPFVTDFGLATYVGGGGFETTTGILVGTPNFMAPEVWMGHPATPAADQFSFGAMLYLIRYGALAYPSEGIESILTAVRKGWEPQLPGEAGDPPLGALILRCLARDGEDRFPHMDAVASELRDVAEELEAANPGPAPAWTRSFTLPPVAATPGDLAGNAAAGTGGLAGRRPLAALGLAAALLGIGWAVRPGGPPPAPPPPVATPPAPDHAERAALDAATALLAEEDLAPVRARRRAGEAAEPLAAWLARWPTPETSLRLGRAGRAFAAYAAAEVRRGAAAGRPVEEFLDAAEWPRVRAAVFHTWSQVAAAVMEAERAVHRLAMREGLRGLTTLTERVSDLRQRSLEVREVADRTARELETLGTLPPALELAALEFERYDEREETARPARVLARLLREPETTPWAHQVVLQTSEFLARVAGLDVLSCGERAALTADLSAGSLGIRDSQGELIGDLLRRAVDAEFRALALCPEAPRPAALARVDRLLEAAEEAPWRHAEVGRALVNSAARVAQRYPELGGEPEIAARLARVARVAGFTAAP